MSTNNFYGNANYQPQSSPVPPAMSPNIQQQWMNQQRVSNMNLLAAQQQQYMNYMQQYYGQYYSQQPDNMYSYDQYQQWQEYMANNNNAMHSSPQLQYQPQQMRNFNGPSTLSLNANNMAPPNHMNNMNYNAQQQMGNNSNWSGSSNNLLNTQQSMNVPPPPPPSNEENVDHTTFIPPAPQSRTEMDKFVEWQMKRSNTSKQKLISKQMQKSESIRSMNTEQQKNANWTNYHANQQNDDTQIKEADKKVSVDQTDYIMMNDVQTQSKCCCTVL